MSKGSMPKVEIYSRPQAAAPSKNLKRPQTSKAPGSKNIQAALGGALRQMVSGKQAAITNASNAGTNRYGVAALQNDPSL